MLDWKPLAALAALAVIACGPAAAQEPPKVLVRQPAEFAASAVVEIDPQGKVLQVEPDATLPEEVRKLLASRIAGWQFEAPRFQGRAVRARQLFQLRLQLAPTSAGGYGVRVLSAGVAPVMAGFALPSLRFDGHPPKGAILLAYVVSIDAEGQVADIQPAWREKRPRGVRVLDSAARHAIETSPAFVRTVDGTPVACRAVQLIQVSFDGTVAPDRTAEIRKAEDALPDLCPKAGLLTKVVGTAL